MVHLFLAAPFADAARAAQFAAVRAALEADAATDSLLLGNLVLEDGTAPLDAVVLRPHSITLLLLVPGGGELGIPVLHYGSWALNGTALAGSEDFDNPFEQFRQQQALLAAWLRPRFTPTQADLAHISGLVVFETPLTFSPTAEAALREAPANFQLLAGTADLPSRLHQLATPAINLTAADLAEWAAELRAFASGNAEAPAKDDSAPRTPQAAASAAGSFLSSKARALWGWLGANDVPNDDLPYGVVAALTARNEEKEQLEHLRQQMQADVQAQLQALEAREAERERSIAQLRAELAQAPSVAAEATALVSRLGAETRAKAALEAEVAASRAELAARNQELDAKIKQLSQLIDQLSAAPPVAAPTGPVVGEERPAVAPLPTATPGWQAAAGAATPGVASAPPPPRTAVALDALFPAPVAPAAPAAAPIAASTAGGAGSTAKAAETPVVSAQATAAMMQRLRAQTAKAWAASRPQLERAIAWGWARPRVLLGAAGVVLVLLVVVLGRRGGPAPVPYQENGRWGYADASGKPVIEAQFASAAPFREGQAVVKQDGAFGLVDERGNTLVAPAYDAINPYRGGYARVRVGDAYTFLEEDGQEFDHFFFNAYDFAEGYAAVLDHRGWFYIDGPEVPEQPVIFREAYPFVDDLARVRLPDGYTFITADYLKDPARGTKPFGRYRLAADFRNGKARVTQNGRSFLIDKNGEEVK